jgi:hypothetical protein
MLSLFLRQNPNPNLDKREWQCNRSYVRKWKNLAREEGDPRPAESSPPRPFWETEHDPRHTATPVLVSGFGSFRVGCVPVSSAIEGRSDISFANPPAELRTV